MLCGYAGKDKGTLKGDSGGPLVCEIDEKAVVVGVNSFGKHPDVFARVPHVVPWILDKMVGQAFIC